MATEPVFSYLCLFCVAVSAYISFDWWMRAFVMFSVFHTKPRDWFGEASPKWPLLCRVGRKTTTQSTAYLFMTSSLFADVQRNTMSLLLGGQQIHVVRNEELARSRNGRAPVGHEFRRTEVRTPVRTAKLQTKQQSSRRYQISPPVRCCPRWVELSWVWTAPNSLAVTTAAPDDGKRHTVHCTYIRQHTTVV